MLLQPAGDGTQDVLAADLVPVLLGFAAGGARGVGGVVGFLEDDFGHGLEIGGGSGWCSCGSVGDGGFVDGWEEKRNECGLGDG